MRGHLEIIAARIDGKKPPFVFINDFPCSTDWLEFGEHATVCTHGDLLSSMDFRFLTGLKVSISAHSEHRAKALFERIKGMGATHVAACHVQAEKHALDQAGWASVWCKESSNG